MNSAVFDTLAPDVASKVANSPEHSATLEWDEQWRSDNTALLVDSYTAWLAK